MNEVLPDEIVQDYRKKYTFGDGLPAEFPSQVGVDVTELCNLACVHCPHPTFKQSEHYAGRRLDLELVEKASNEIRDHGKGLVQYMRFTGDGEPLIHPKIFEMLTYAVRESGTTVTLTTNGTILDQRRIERLLDTGTQIVDISIDAFRNETYEKVRVNGNLDVTRANVLDLIKRSKERGNGPRVVVSYVEQPLNADETADFESFWNDSGADYVVIRRLHSCSAAKEDLADQMRREAETLQRRPCLYPWERIVLNPRGELSFCPSDWVHGAAVADYRTTTIRETWRGEFYRRLREAHLTNDYKDFSFCGNCPDWRHTRWPDEGRRYADMVKQFKETE